MVAVHWTRALRDNYIYLIVSGEEAAVVDPGEAAPVEAALAPHGVRLTQIWCTHHHWDHTGAVAELAGRHGAEVLGSEPDDGRIPAQTRKLRDGERFDFGGHTVEAMLIPGHTLGHVAYVGGGNAFPGDTLFGAGCGRLFEGTPAMMFASLARLAALPDDTRVWCGHEYTLQNLRFALSVDPDNEALRARYQNTAERPDKPTIPLSIVVERATNPFVRAPTIETFAAVRKQKDEWKG